MSRTTFSDVHIDLMFLAVGMKVRLLLAFWRIAQAGVTAYTVLSPCHCQARQSVKGGQKGGMGKGNLVLHKNMVFWFSFMDYFFPKLHIFCCPVCLMPTSMCFSFPLINKLRGCKELTFCSLHESFVVKLYQEVEMQQC